MEKTLFFRSGENLGNGYLLSSLQSIEAGDSTLKFKFDVHTTADIILDDPADDHAYDEHTLNLKSGADELIALKEVAEKLTSTAHHDGIIVVADDRTGEYITTLADNDGNALDAVT